MNPRRRPFLSDSGRRHKPDYMLAALVSILLGIGLVLLVAISPALTAQTSVAGSYYVVRQLIAGAIGVGLFFVVSRLDLAALRWLVKPLAVVSLLLAGAVLAISGVAFRWIQIGGISFQPAELIKFTIVIGASIFLADQVSQQRHRDDRSTLVPIGIMMAVVGLVIVILERDLGSMVVMTAIVLGLLLMANVPLAKIAAAGGVVLLLGLLAIASTPYRRDRLATFLNPQRDCSAQGYHACQALIAVGSGGVAGLGLSRSVQEYGYLPEASNDSIFAVYAEKFGFIGCLLLLAVYGVLLTRILRIARRAPDMASQLLCVGVFIWIAVQSLMNIGAMVGLLPLKGITLPLISYGGTSLMFVMAGLGLVFRVSGYTQMRASLNTGIGRQDSRPARPIVRLRAGQ